MPTRRNPVRTAKPAAGRDTGATHPGASDSDDFEPGSPEASAEGEEEQEEEVVSDAPQTVTKRLRGRPRKRQRSDDEPSTTLPKRRGRPPKSSQAGQGGSTATDGKGTRARASKNTAELEGENSPWSTRRYHAILSPSLGTGSDKALPDPNWPSTNGPPEDAPFPMLERCRPERMADCCRTRISRTVMWDLVESEKELKGQQDRDEMWI